MQVQAHGGSVRAGPGLGLVLGFSALALSYLVGPISLPHAFWRAADATIAAVNAVGSQAGTRCARHHVAAFVGRGVSTPSHVSE